MPDATEVVMGEASRFAPRCLYNIAPERGAELQEDIFGLNKWTIRNTDGWANFYAIPQDAVILLSHAGLASLWCLAYAAYHLMDIGSRLQRMPDLVNGASNINIGEYFVALQLGEYIAYARRLFHVDAEWPQNLNKPNVQAVFESSDGRLNNLFFGALSWIILHEVGHVHHQDEVLVPVDKRINQEYQADRFATTWVLDNAGNGLRREFRILMVLVALSWLFLHESEKGRGATHPPAILRFREAQNHFNIGDRSPGLENACYFLKAIFDPLTESPAFDTPKEAFNWMAGRLEQLFPV